MAKAAVEMAAWDLRAAADAPLSRLLGGTRARDRRPASRSASRTRSSSCSSKIAIELAAGYQRIKIKIKPGWDIAAVERDPRALRRHCR